MQRIWINSVWTHVNIVEAIEVYTMLCFARNLLISVPFARRARLSLRTTVWLNPAIIPNLDNRLNLAIKNVRNLPIHKKIKVIFDLVTICECSEPHGVSIHRRLRSMLFWSQTGRNYPRFSFTELLFQSMKRLRSWSGFASTNIFPKVLSCRM